MFLWVCILPYATVHNELIIRFNLFLTSEWYCVDEWWRELITFYFFFKLPDTKKITFKGSAVFSVFHVKSCPTLAILWTAAHQVSPILQQLLEFAQIHVHCVCIQPSHPPCFLLPPGLSSFQHQVFSNEPALLQISGKYLLVPCAPFQERDSEPTFWNIPDVKMMYS